MNLGAMELGFVGIRGALHHLLDDLNEWTHWRDILELAAGWARAQSGNAVAPRGNCSVRAMNVRDTDALEKFVRRDGRDRAFPCVIATARRRRCAS